jgi:redox-sensitive bicupin YhaK (pirin superfamily)
MKPMKYVAEQDRKFTDMGGVKIYHSIFPVKFSPDDKAWGPVIRFDNKVLLPGRQEVQHFIGSPIQVLRIAINGSVDYFDSWGYRTVLGEQDTLSVISGKEILSAVLQNNDDQTDTELLEIWLLSNQDERSYQFHSGPASREKGKFYTVISNDDKDENDQPQQKKSLRIGTFNAGQNYTIHEIPDGQRLILFVFNGEVSANGQQLNYRDTIIFSKDSSISLDFKKDTNLFLMEIGKEVVTL